MVNRNFVTRVHVIAVFTVTFGFASLTCADVFEPTKQQRSVTSVVQFIACDDSETVEQSAPDFGQFNGASDVELLCDPGWSVTLATQESEITASGLSATGLAFFKVTGINDDVGVLSLSHSQADVTFDLTALSHVSIQGLVSASSTDEIAGLAFGSTVQLFNSANNEVIVDHDVNANPQANSFTIDDEVTLEPGAYRIEINAVAGFEGGSPASAAGEASFDITMDVQAVGDLTGDGVIGVDDLLQLLAAWGSCPAPPADCPADLDEDGQVGVSDLLALLANWS